MLVDNNSHTVTLLELDLEYFELNPTQPIQWPKQINGHIVPRVDAALILYDVTNHDSVAELPQTLGMRFMATAWKENILNGFSGPYELGSSC